MLPAEPAVSVRTTRLDRACLVAAFAILLAWFFIFDRSRPDYLVDEPGHLTNIYHILEAKPGWPEAMTMLPGYHYLVAALWQLHPPFSLLTLSRLVVTLSAFLGLAAFAFTWTRLHRPNFARQSPLLVSLAAAGPATLLLAVLPIFQPFTGLAYTDAPALAFTFVAIAAHFAGHRALAALAFIPALLTRQTNLLWPAFLIAYEIAAAPLANPFGYTSPRSPAPSPSAAPPSSASAPADSLFRRTRWLLLLLALSAGAVAVALLTTGRLTPGTQTGNDPHFNPATLHFAGLLTLVLGLPLWLAHTPAALRDFRSALLTHRAVALTLTVVALAAATGLALTFRNPHQWNRDLFWDGCTFTLLRNWPLVWLDHHAWLRAASGLNLILMTVALTRTIAAQPHRRALLLVLFFGLFLPFTNSLVEPRYFIPAAAFTLLFLDLSPITTRRLTAWWLLLCVLHAPFIARGLSLW